MITITIKQDHRKQIASVTDGVETDRTDYMSEFFDRNGGDRLEDYKSVEDFVMVLTRYHQENGEEVEIRSKTVSFCEICMVEESDCYCDQNK